jgi:hypothetical protein
VSTYPAVMGQPSISGPLAGVELVDADRLATAPPPKRAEDWRTKTAL